MSFGSDFEESRAEEGMVETATIGKPYGLSGFLNLYSENTASNLMRSDCLKLRSRRGKLIDVRIKNVTDGRNRRLVKFEGYDAREAARALSGSVLLIDEAHARPLGKGEVRYKDLIGLEVVFEQERVGEVSSLIEGAQSLLLEVRRDYDGKTFLVPYMKVFVDEPDLEKKRIRLLDRGLIG